MSIFGDDEIKSLFVLYKKHDDRKILIAKMDKLWYPKIAVNCFMGNNYDSVWHYSIQVYRLVY